MLKKIYIFLFILFLFPISCFAQESISSERLQISINNNSQGINIVSIYDKQLGNELLNTSVNLFSLSLEKLVDNSTHNISSNSNWGNISISSPRPDKFLIGFSNPTSTGLPSSLKVDITIEIINKKSLWDMSVSGISESYSLMEVTFPSFNIKADGNDNFLLPYYSGKLIKNPSDSISYEGLYPRGWGTTMQFLSYYNDDYGLYFGFHDPKAAIKTFLVKNENNGVKLEGVFPIPNKTIGANDWEFPGNFQMELYQGNWYEASQKYKKWASENAEYRPKKSESRKKRQASMGNIGVWTYYSNNTNLDKTEGNMRKFIDFMDIPVGIHWYNWNYKLFDDDYPVYFPEKAKFIEIVESLQEYKDVVIMPYINGRLFDTDLLNYETDGFPYASKDRNGNIYSQKFSGNNFAVMCPTTKPWQDILVDTANQLTSRIGTLAIYIDQVAAASPRECMDPSHNHKLGGGNLWRDGYKQMFQKINSTIPDNRFITVEGGVDFLADEVDGFLVGGRLTDNLVPAFSAVYAGKVQLFSVNTGTSKYGNQSFYGKMAQAFSFGIQPGRVSLFIVQDESDIGKMAANFTKRLGTMRYKLKKFMSFGQMHKPLELKGTIPNINYIVKNYGIETEVINSAIQSSVWQNGKSIAVVFVNGTIAGTDDSSIDFSFDFDGSIYGLTGDIRIQKVTDTTDSIKSSINNNFTQEVSLSPLESVAYIITYSDIIYNLTEKDYKLISKIEKILYRLIDNKKNITAEKVIKVLKKWVRKMVKDKRRRKILNIIINDIKKRYFLDEYSQNIYPPESIFTEIPTDSNLKSPNYLKSIIDSKFNIKFTRVSDLEAFQESDIVLKPVHTSHILPPYPKNQAWSYDGKYIRINNTLIDGNNYQIIKNIGGSVFERKWSYTENNIIYGIMYEYNNNGEKTHHIFVRQNVDTLEIEKVHKFSTEDYDQVLLGPWEGNISFDDKLVVFSAQKGNDLIAIVYDIKNNKILKEKTMENYWDKLDWISISPLGNYILINGESGDEEGDNTSSIYKYDINLNFINIVSNQGSHGDMGINEKGEEVYVQFEFGGEQRGIRMHNLLTGISSKILPSKYNGGHVSCRNYNYPGRCYLSTHQEGFREVLAVKLDDSETVRRFGQTHQIDSSSSYGSPNPNGTKVLFKSFWGEENESAFISEISVEGN